MSPTFLGAIGAALRREFRVTLHRSAHLFHAVPLRGLEQTGERWRVCEESGLFELRTSQAVLPGGFVEIETRIVAESGGPPAAALLVDAGVGFDASDPIHLRRATAGDMVTLARLPSAVRGLRLRIAPGADFDVKTVRIREISQAEAFARLGGPLLKRRFAEPRDIPVALTKLVGTLRAGGPRSVLDRLLHKETQTPALLLYSDWRRLQGNLSVAGRAAIRTRLGTLNPAPSFSVLLPVFNPPEPWLRRAIESVRGQIYDRWELCIADDASTLAHVRSVLGEAAAADRRIKVAYRTENGHISAASNTAVSLATGDFVVLLDHDDELSEDALALLAEEVAAHPQADVLYSDEDKIDEEGRRYDPFFKPDWNPDLLLSQNYVGHLLAVRRSLVERVGAFRQGFEGSQDHDLVLRASRQARDVRHLPFVLYHWRSVRGSTAREASAKTYTGTAGIRAVQEHVGRRASVEAGPFPNTYRVRWRVPASAPLVSLLIPTRDQRQILETCVESILSKTGYRNFELLIVDNQSSAGETLDYLASVEQRGVARVLRFDAPFNFSAINNFAAGHARGTVLGLLNNDLEVVEGGWLEEMVSHAMRPEIGAVGARLLYPDGTVQHGGIVLGIGGVAGHAHKHTPSDAPGYFSRARLVHDVSAVTAACLLIRRESFEKVGGMDESFPIAFNDVDFCLRVRDLGLRNLWTPFATLLHHESRTRGHEDTAAKRARFRGEMERMISRWGEVLRNDPAYNPNLTLDSEDFSLAWPPRVRRP